MGTPKQRHVGNMQMDMYKGMHSPNGRRHRGALQQGSDHAPNRGPEKKQKFSNRCAPTTHCIQAVGAYGHDVGSRQNTHVIVRMPMRNMVRCARRLARVNRTRFAKHSTRSTLQCTARSTQPSALNAATRCMWPGTLLGTCSPANH